MPLKTLLRQRIMMFNIARLCPLLKLLLRAKTTPIVGKMWANEQCKITLIFSQSPNKIRTNVLYEVMI